MVIRALNKPLERYPAVHEALMAAEGWRLARRLDLLYTVQRKEAVIVFQMGKVGSSSVQASFPTPQHPLAVQIHNLHIPRIEATREALRSRGLPVRRHYFHGEAVARRVIDAGRPYKLITAVREPISRSVSHFFQAFDMFAGMPVSASHHSVEELTEIFLANEEALDRANWFEVEFEPALGVDVYAHPFDPEVGHQRIPTDHGEILLMKLEIDDAVKERAIGDLLGEPSFTLRSANMGEEKDYADTYRRFRDEVVLPLDYVERALDSRYARHFYSDAELDAVRRTWTERLGAS